MVDINIRKRRTASRNSPHRSEVLLRVELKHVCKRSPSAATGAAGEPSTAAMMPGGLTT